MSGSDNKLCYTVAIHVPVYVDGDKTYFESDWWRALDLLRKSLGDRIGEMRVVAPTRRVGAHQSSHELLSSEGLDLQVIPSMDLDGRARQYWLKDRARWLRDVRDACQGAQIAHLGLCNLYRPINLDAFRQADAEQGLFKVFYRDTDEIEKIRGLAAEKNRALSTRERLYIAAYKRALIYCVRESELPFLKGAALFNKFRLYNQNTQTFEDTSYHDHEIISRDSVEERLATNQDRGLRFVYCGRFEYRKGVPRMLEILAKARAGGAEISLDLIGDGEEAAALRALVDRLQLQSAVRFLGKLPYDAALLKRLGTYDGLFFTPLAEDTPRMIFDGYAAGLPLIATDIPFVRERDERDSAVLPLPLADITGAAERLIAFAKDREYLARLTRNAHHAATVYSADRIYEFRARKTYELYDEFEARHER